MRDAGLGCLVCGGPAGDCQPWNRTDADGVSVIRVPEMRGENVKKVPAVRDLIDVATGRVIGSVETFVMVPDDAGDDVAEKEAASRGLRLGKPSKPKTSSRRSSPKKKEGDDDT